MKSRMTSVYFCCALALALPSVFRGQSCTITSPTAAQLIQIAAPVQLTATVSSAPTAYSLEYDIDYRRWRKAYNDDQHPKIGDFGDNYQGPWVATWYSALYGDGPHVVSGVLRDIFGATLAICPTVSFTVRVEGMSFQSVNSLPNQSGNTISGVGKYGFLTFDGKNNGGGFYVDGRPLPQSCGAAGGTSQPGGGQIPAMNTTCGFTNGPHLITGSYAQTNIQTNYGEPYVLGAPITSVSGTSVYFGGATNCPFLTSIGCHYSVQTTAANPDVVTFSTTGSQYTGVNNGTQCYWATSTTNTCSVTVSIAAGTMTFTCSPACGPTASNQPVYVRNIQSTDQTTGLMNCDGLYTNETFISSTSFSIPAPAGCPNGAAANLNLEVDWNPYFANYVDSMHISVSANPNGASPVTLSGSCTGTCTVSQRIRSPYWTGANSSGNVKLGTDFATNGGPAVITVQPTFSNGHSPMEIRPPYWEYHGWPGKTGDTLAAIVEYTDLSSSACGGGCSYSVTADGTVSGAISVNTSTGAITYAPTSSWSNPSAPTAWAQATVTCTTCSVGVTSVTVYIEEDPGSAPVFPHYTTCGTIATTFTTGSCHSFYPSGIQDSTAGTDWQGPGVYTAGHFNTLMTGLSGGSNLNLINPTATSCPSYPDSVMTTNQNFAAQYGLSLEFDIYNVWFNLGSGISSPPIGGGLGTILNNVGYNRRACLSTFVNYMVSTGKYFGFFNDDETTFQTGVILRMNPTIQASISSTWGNGWTSAAVSGSGITFSVVNPQSLAGNWSQSAGTGSWIQIVNATNTCLNGWYPILTSNSTQWTSNNRGSCANGTYKPSGGILETTAQIAVNQSPLGSQNGTPNPTDNGGNNQQNSTVLPSNLSAINQLWDTNLTSIVVSSCTATVHWTGNLIPNGTAIRIWMATTANLNIVAPIASGTNTFTFTYPNIGTGEACPANGTYNSTTDPNLIVTVDPNWGPDPVGTFFSIVNAVTGAPSTVMSIQGGNFDNAATTYSYDGNRTNVGGAFVFNGGSPTFYLGDSGGVWQNINFDTEAVGNAGGLATRAFQSKPRGVLWGWGVVNGGYSIQTTCRSFTFNPGCDRPVQLSARPEDIIAQIFGGKTHDYARIRGYNLMSDMTDGYGDFCCGWQAIGGTGTGGGLNPYVAPKAFKAGALANALLTLRTETELQPEANKPYFGPYFTTDAHFSATYGNELQIVCGSESPYGSFQVTLPQISGGSMLKYILTGYSLSMSVLAGNPATDTDEFCGMPGNASIAAPGRITTYVALPPSPPFQPADRISFSAPATLPFGASKFLLQVGYYQPEMQDDPVTDCTSGCTIAIDHHNMAAWYRVIYTDSNNQPRSIGDPMQIFSQGLY